MSFFQVPTGKPGQSKVWVRSFLLSLVVSTAYGCASTYGNLVSGSKLGAQEYEPSVLIRAGKESEYQQILSVCREVAVKRQITSSQEAQLSTITGVTSGALEGGAFGLQIGSVMKNADFDASLSDSLGIGMAAGMLSGFASSFLSGTENAAEETKRILLNCLGAADPDAAIYSVLE